MIRKLGTAYDNVSTRAFIGWQNFVDDHGIKVVASAVALQGTNAHAQAANNAGEMGENVGNQVAGIFNGAEKIVALVGFFLFCYGVHQLIYRDKSQHSVGKCFGMIIVGIVFFSPFAFLSMGTGSVVGEDTSNQDLLN